MGPLSLPALTRKRTNLLVQSQAFDDAAWVKTGLTVTANATMAPDGSLTADKLEETAVTSGHLAVQSFTFAAAPYGNSLHLKAAERSFALLSLSNTVFVASINLATGAVTAANGSPLGVGSASAGDGWWRTWLIGVPPAGTAGLNVYISQDGVFANRSYLGVAGSGIYAWGAQLERDAVSPYIPTDASPVTRFE